MLKRNADQAEEADSARNASAALPEELRPWLAHAWGDERDGARAALSAGSDATDDLVAVRCALAAIADEESPLDPEDRQRALLAAMRLLRERTALLRCAFDYLWAAQ